MAFTRRRMLALAAGTAGWALAAETSWPALREEARRVANGRWRPVLECLAEMHRRGTHPRTYPFPYDWEEIGPGYHWRAFGHWDIVHAILDVLPSLRMHAENQIRNDLANQTAEGLIPGVIWMVSPGNPAAAPKWSKVTGHPPLWPVAVDEYVQLYGASNLLAECFEPLVRQIGWFEAHRKAEPEGFWYSRVSWESGVDDDLRQPGGDAQRPRRAYLDATCHVYNLYDTAARWAYKLGHNAEALQWRGKAQRLGDYVRTELWADGEGRFYDAWSVRNPDARVGSFVTIWPLVFGIADQSQADAVIDRHVMNTNKFLAVHPIRSLAKDSSGYDMLMWHGPTWNSTTYWTARGCMRFGRRKEARGLLESALEQTAKQFARSGTIWEYYHPEGGNPESLEREIKAPHEQPRRDYTGHNPLFAMARLFEKLP